MGEVVFQIGRGGFIFKWRVTQWPSILVGGGLKKIIILGRGAPSCLSVSFLGIGALDFSEILGVIYSCMWQLDFFGKNPRRAKMVKNGPKT